MRKFGTMFFILLLSGRGWATEALAANPAFASGAVISQVVGGMGLVTVAIFVLAWLVKRLGGAGLLQHKGMSLLASMPLGAREKIVLIEVENTKILLGVAHGSVSRLHVFATQATQNNIDGSAARQAGDVANAQAGDGRRDTWDFAHYLKQLTQHGPSP